MSAPVAAPPVAAPPVIVMTDIVMTDIAGVQHFVTEAAVARGRHAGCYLGVCGNPVVAASLTAPDGVACPSCRAWGTGWPG